jgi:hypothetical protein
MKRKIITAAMALPLAAVLTAARGGTSSAQPAAPLPPGTHKGCQELHNWLGTINPNGNFTLSAQEGNKILNDAGSSSFNSDFYNWLNSTSKSGEASAGRKINADCQAYYRNILAATGVSPWPVSAPAPSPSPSTPAPDTVTYEITGDAPSGVISPSITYGPSGSTLPGTVPMDVTQDIPSNPPSYYAINAQLSDAGGSITCSILVDGKVISQATAQGADNICTAEIDQNPITNEWENTNAAGG